MTTRRQMLKATMAMLGSAGLLGSARRILAQPAMKDMIHTHDHAARSSQRVSSARGGPGRVVTPNGMSLPWTMEEGFKTFHLVAEPVKREFAPGLVVNCWGYNGQTPGPTIEAQEGDRVRIYVTNKLPEPTSVHWHGLILPNGMDGLSGLRTTYRSRRNRAPRPADSASSRNIP